MKPKKLFNNLEEFNRFKDPQTVIITDIDGTISKISTKPNEATVTNSMKNVLVQLQKKYHNLIIITGRSLEDAFKMIDIPDAVYIGNHGMEYMDDGLIILDEATVSYIPTFRELNEKLKNDKNINIEGITLETKETSTSIHYRTAQNPETTRKTILNTLDNMEEAENLKIKEGKKVIEIRPPVGNDKGKIINKIIKRYGTQLIYLGDDVTDRDAFKQISQLVENDTVTGKSIVVCSEEIPSTVFDSADYYVENVDRVEDFFKWLIQE